MNWYIVVGRVPFADEDTAGIHQAKDQHEAVELFVANELYPDGVPEENEDNEPPLYYLNYVIECDTEPRFALVNV